MEKKKTGENIFLIKTNTVINIPKRKNEQENNIMLKFTVLKYVNKNT